MPEKKEIYSIKAVVASPSDVRDERMYLRSVVDALNRQYMLSRDNIQIELIMWEHIRGGTDKSAQEVINRQLPKEYDILIAIIWTTVGTTPTDDFISGTMEEIGNALDNQIEVMAFFKTTPPESLANIDANKLAEVENLKTLLGKRGTLFKEFDSMDEFGDRIRENFSIYVNELKNDTSYQDSSGVSAINKEEPPEEAAFAENSPTYEFQEIDEDIGLFDLVDERETVINLLVKSCDNIGEATQLIRLKTESRAAKINQLAQNVDSKNKDTLRKEFRSTLNGAASDLNHYSDRLEAEVPVFKKQLDSSLYITDEIVEVMSNVENHDNLKEMKCEHTSLQKSLKSMKGSLEEYIEAVTNLPRFTTELNRAKRRTSQRLRDFTDSISSGEAKLIEIGEKIDSIIKSDKKGD